MRRAYNGLMSAYFNPEGDLAGKALPARPQAPQALETYAGDYKNAYFGAANIAVDKRQLVLTLGPSSERVVMARGSTIDYLNQNRMGTGQR